ncbi:saccharopine dehydrogenase family protein [Natrarchaeobaculum sulfurireducens]|uniref:Integral membrane protein (Rhomboid family) n=1 Tax=Natrarchaeobaculum sulfurireducens TaxID=2044521 RepID=A0A346PN11_9EURY|nr:saccharopine dehydrogenase NADP-binding domain-containing protein [Natrarchaeobaculum sulfurireducens]AXR80906.1 Integral membrane protein (Rhomboid family) [Natrarchaeobaculum sulfurireducens]
MNSLLIYGSYGYTGRLVAREAVSRGGTPIVAGRDGRQVSQQAAELGLEGRSFDLESPALASHLEDVDALLNCAGPFIETAEPLFEACLEAETDYLDITGEFPVFERFRRRDDVAREAGITALPGVGFEVVPSDCLAAFLHGQLPEADELALGITGSPTFSRGTAHTLLELLGTGVVRRNGRLVEVPTTFRTRQIDFGDGAEPAVTAPWADVVTAAHTTGIETIEVYVAVPPVAKPLLPLADVSAWLVDRTPVRRLLEQGIDALVDGPDEHQLATETAVVWGEARDSETGRSARARLRTPNPYALTVDAVLAAAERVLDAAHHVPAGFQTPASAFGADFALGLEGVERELVSTPGTSHRIEVSAADD